MKNKLYTYPLLVLIFTVIWLTSCLDDGTDYSIDEEWKYLNERAFNELPTINSIPAGEYRILVSQSNNGYIKWKTTDAITKSDKKLMDLKITAEGKPEFTDTVYVRYEGWYFTKDDQKIIFDSTENPITGSENNPNSMKVKFAVSGVMDGWTTVLTDMKAGEEREVWIPWALGYGSSQYGSIPGYTTLRFNIKLIEIIPMNGRG